MSDKLKKVIDSYRDLFHPGHDFSDLNGTGPFDTLLHIAAREGQAANTEILIGANADINKANVDGYTPLMEAVYYGHKNVVKVLVSHGADLNLKNMFDQTAYDIAVERKEKEIMTILKPDKTSRHLLNFKPKAKKEAKEKTGK
ncbi:MAG: ankyrin repeat domain-containing protein [Erysipelotrichaceae bacterium]|jgi:ankyrin repeat protein|nr:ankyrin repeat domain-containing protein [Erysipelotrichaceae bacterium]